MKIQLNIKWKLNECIIQIQMNKKYLPFHYWKKSKIKNNFPRRPSKLRVKRSQIWRAYSNDIKWGPDRFTYMAEMMSRA